jgi:hypothetical protein
MKAKTLLFGAGQGSLKMKNNLSGEHEFIGYLDNDERKIGSTFGGLPVYSPLFLNRLEFDKIIISTQWALPVEQQLIHELGVSPDKIVLPQKKQLKNLEPFSNPKSMQLARNIIVRLNKLAIQSSIPLVIDFGTLLGIVRDQDIIPWDDDIDFSAPVEYAQAVEKILANFCEQSNDEVNWRVTGLRDENHNIAGYCLDFDDPQQTISSFTTSLCFRRNKNGNAEHLPSLGMWYAPQHHFAQITLHKWLGKLIQVPYQYQEYLSFVYGQWHKPKKDMQLSDYAHLQQVEFSDIQRAGFKSASTMDIQRDTDQNMPKRVESAPEWSFEFK